MKRKRMKKSRKILFSLLLTVLALVLMYRLIAPPRPSGWQEYTVRRGDTLWSIASAYGDGYDPRNIIDEIERKNGCNADIDVGDVLLIPEY